MAAKWQYNIEPPSPKAGKREFPVEEGKGVIFCSGCGAFHYQKAWHCNKNKKPLSIGDLPKGEKTKSQKLVLCPACKMIKDKEFAGQLTIINFPAASKDSLVKLIDNFCQRARERNSLHRLIGIRNVNGDLVATTTENQLAVKLAKKIKEVFNKYKIQMKISYSPEPSETAYVKINFAPTPIKDK